MRTTEATHTFFSFQRIKFAADLKVFFVPNFLVYVCERCRDREKERRVRKSARRKYTKGDPRDGFHTVLSVTGPSFSLPTQNPSLWLRRNSIKSNIDRREEEKKKCRVASRRRHWSDSKRNITTRQFSLAIGDRHTCFSLSYVLYKEGLSATELSKQSTWPSTRGAEWKLAK